MKNTICLPREPSIQSILITLQERYDALGLNRIKEAVEQSESSMKVQLLDLLTDCKSAIPDFISKLPFFQVHNSNSFVSAEDCRLVNKDDIPDVWNKEMSRLVVRTHTAAQVAQKVKITEWTFKDICKDMIRSLCRMSYKQKCSFFDWIMHKVSMTKEENLPESFIQAIKPHLHVQTSANRSFRQKPSDLFERYGLCSVAFGDEESKFPNKKYSTGVLKQLGLKGDNEVSSDDIESAIDHITKKHNQKVSDTFLSKVEAMLKLINNNFIHIQAPSPWIPIAVEKPSSYPSNLHWFANCYLATPGELFVKGDEDYVGSVCCIVHPKIDKVFKQCFKQRKEPNIKDVLSHLRHIHRSYDDEQKGCYKKMVFHIYEYLSKNSDALLAHKDSIHMIWQGQNFVPLSQATLEDLKISVEPYFFKVPLDVLSRFGDALYDLVNSDSDYNLYLDVLKTIADKNDTRKSTKHHRSDLQLSIELVEYLANNELKRCLENKESIYVPVNGPLLKLFPLSECYYVDKANSIKYKATVSTNKIFHSEFSKEIAKKLKVTNLINKVLGGRNSNFIKPWGQTEPLTRRLKRILEDYQDGLAIIKELIQNADDAGASTVKLLYDKRQNKNTRDLLFDPGMRDWQGPALWVFNDQVFTESDFENITKVNAGTKEFDTRKIGKFGLGFNSVYHLTDVPSFLSGDSLIIFDPHTKYLGEALESKDVPGIRIKLTENFRELSNFRHQFEVYNGIFGTTFDFDKGHFDSYNGTLFRLPLRQQELAEKSEIKKLEYSDNEVKRLLSKVKNSLSDLILFTTNITHVEVLELNNISSNCITDVDLKSLFKVCKNSSPADSNSGIVGMTNEELTRAKAIAITGIASNYEPKRGNFISQTEMKVWHSSRLFSTQQWLTVSSVGSKASFRYALKNKGHLPCGGVSIPLGSVFQNTKQFDGKLFCFLPLPIKSNFPFHVNAAFSVSKNRQGLLTSSTDNKDYNKESSWNDLIGSDLGQSYMELLVQIAMGPTLLHSEDWVKLVLPSPTGIHEKFAENMITELLTRLVDTRNKSPVFPASHSWLPWNAVKTLDRNISKDLAGKCKEFLNWLYSYKHEPTECIIFPIKFHDLLIKFGFQDNLNEIIVQENDVYKLFLENIGNNRLSHETRNNLLNHILDTKPGGDLCEQLKKTRCIPTKPNGKLKFPSELVKEDSKASTVYTINDEVFPNLNGKHLDYLTKGLGMQKDKLPWTMLIERARSVEALHKLSKTEVARSRLKFLLQLMSDAKSITDNHKCVQLQDIAFLEAMSRPKDRLFLPWHAQELFGKPKDLHIKRLQDVVCCSAMVCQNDLPINVSCLLKQSPVRDVVVFQLKQIIKASQDKGTLTEPMIEVLHSIYQHIGEGWARCLDGLNWILTTDKTLKKPSKVFVNIETKIPGFLYELHRSLKENKRLSRLVKLYGVRDDCNSFDCIQALMKIHAHYNDRVIPRNALNSIIRNVVPFLCNSFISTVKELYLPDEAGVIRLSSELCYKDQDWLPLDKHVKFLHEGIPRSYAKILQIKSLSADLFIRQPDVQGLWFDFGQKEDLTTRIKNLLLGYSDEEDIFKEMFQNADDAGATEIEFILDKRHHGDETVFSQKWKPLQGPAFSVCNDGKFTVEDLEGIQRLGVGSKKEDPLSTGKYGVGFNSVYGITDCPILLTKVGDLGDVLCIFDPNLLYADGATVLCPGRMMKNARTVLQPYEDVKSSLLFNEVESVERTLFRFPLRNDEMSRTSKIRDEPVNLKVFEELMSTMSKRANNFLLFLKNISTVRFKVIHENGQILENEFVANIFGVTNEERQKFNQYQKNFTSILHDLEKLRSEWQLIGKQVCVQHNSNKRLVNICHWEVVEQCGFQDVYFDSAFEFHLRYKPLHLIPKGGIAKITQIKNCVYCANKICSSSVKNPEIKQEGVFCTLPLPLQTGFPAIINGNFILDYETRRNLWINKASPIYHWNFYILKGCVLPCFIHYMTRYADSNLGPHITSAHASLAVRAYYDIFPISRECKSEHWIYLADEFYKVLFNKNMKLLVVNEDCSVKMCRPQNDFILYKNPDEETQIQIQSSIPEKPNLLECLKKAHVNIDTIPSKVERNFETVRAALTILTPSVLRQRLVDTVNLTLPEFPVQVKESVFETIQNVRTVLNYCVKEAGKKNGELISLDKLPLCVLADGTLIMFSETNRKYLTKYTDFFPSKLNCFVHRDLFFDLWKSGIDMKFFLSFGINEFGCYLDECFPSQFRDQDNPIPLQGDNTIDWIKRMWEFIGSVTTNLTNLAVIEPWSLLLVHKNQVNYLIPIKQRKHAIHFNGIEPLNNILIALGIFQPTPSIYHEDKIVLIFGNTNCANNIVDSMTLAFEHCSNPLSSENAKVILFKLQASLLRLQYTSYEKLKRLPLFERVDGTVTALSTSSPNIMMPSGVPSNGTDLLQTKHSCVFLVNTAFETLYYGLKIRCIDWITFYNEYLLSFFDCFGDIDFDVHIKYLRSMLQYNNSPEVTCLIKSLKVRRFFPARDGTKQVCGNMYHPHNEIFVEMLPSKFFPAERYCNNEWLPFLTKLGLVTELDGDLLVRFCTELAEVEDLEKVKNVSTLLCNELSKNNLQNNFDLLGKISNINFIIPADISEDLEKIHPSSNSRKDRISFNDSCLKTSQRLIWTTKNVLPDYITNVLTDNTKDQLNIVRKNGITTNDVLQNLTNILSNAPKNYRDRTTTFKEIKQELQKPYLEVLERFYKFIKDGSSTFWLNNLTKLSCILVNGGSGLEVPRKSICGKELIITPYLNSVPISLGGYFEIMEAIGCSEKVKPYHLVNVLQEIHDISKSNALCPNEQAVAKKAVCYLSQVLVKERNDDGEIAIDAHVYLPTVSFLVPAIVCMRLSTECLYVDDCHLEERLKEFTAPLTMSSYGNDLDPDSLVNKNLMKYLPESRRPLVLSQCIKEILTDISERQSDLKVGRDHVSNQIKARIKHPLFIENIERLFHHEKQDGSFVSEALSNVKVVVKKSIQTHLVFKDRPIPGSSIDKQLFLRINDKRLEIYFAQSVDVPGHELNSDVADGLLTALGNKLKEKKSLFCFLLLLSEEPNTLSNLLDSKGISRDSTASGYKGLGPPPTPGEPVPLELHDLLRSDFSSFIIGEYVAVQQLDQDDGDSSRHYCYAIFRRNDYNPDIPSRLYGLQLTEDEDDVKEVQAHLVFKFERGFANPENSIGGVALSDFVFDCKAKSYEEIIAEMKKIFKEMVKQDDKTRKMIIRRLLLTWHPDKHPEGTKALATKVFQYMQKLIKNLRDGNIDFDDLDRQARSSYSRYQAYTSQFKRSRHESNYGHGWSSFGTSSSFSSFSTSGSWHTFTPPTFQPTNPQPSEANRWWKQASYDMAAADEITEGHEWACYIAHQV